MLKNDDLMSVGSGENKAEESENDDDLIG